MGLEKIVGRLHDLLESDKARKEKKRVDELRKILAKLAEKRDKTEARMQRAKTDIERRKLERKLKICVKQHAKGREALDKLSR